MFFTDDAQKPRPEFRHLQRFHLMDLFQKLLPHKEVVSGFLSSWQLKYSKTPKQKTTRSNLLFVLLEGNRRYSCCSSITNKSDYLCFEMWSALIYRLVCDVMSVFCSAKRVGKTVFQHWISVLSVGRRQRLKKHCPRSNKGNDKSVLSGVRNLREMTKYRRCFRHIN